jgi:acetylornithine/succinyldiaminopimelate/putrescine aminotransferase
MRRLGIRFSPPLVITKDEVDTGLDRFEAAVKKVSFKKKALAKNQ